MHEFIQSNSFKRELSLLLCYLCSNTFFLQNKQSYCKDSRTRAEAPPPPLQIPATPILPFFSLNTLTRVVTILAPEQPRGWPIATEPPWTLTLASSKPRIFTLAKATTEKASLIS